MRTRSALLLALSVSLLAACGESASTTETTVEAAQTTTSAPATTSPSSTSSVAPATALSGTERELQLASINGVTLAAVKLNTAMLAKAGWATPAASSGSTTTAPSNTATTAGSSAREAGVLLSVLGSSSAPKGYSLRTYGSAGVVDVWDGAKVTRKDLTGLVEYVEISSDNASVCLRPATNGKADTAQARVENDGYRDLPIGKLVQPASAEGWLIMLRIADQDACRTALDTANAP